MGQVLFKWTGAPKHGTGHVYVDQRIKKHVTGHNPVDQHINNMRHAGVDQCMNSMV